MRRTLVILGLLVAVLIAAYGAVSWYFSGMVIAFSPHSLEQQLARHGSPTQYGLPIPEEVRIDAGDVTLVGWLFEQEAEADCGVILLHGIRSSRYGALKYTPLFWDRGCDLLLYDARYHGASAGDYGTYGYYEKQDVLAALGWFMGRTGLTPGQIGFMGESYGGATSLQAAALQPDLAFVAADSSYRDMDTIIAEQAVQRFGPPIRAMVPGALAVSGLRAGFAPSEVSPMDLAEQIQAPVLLVHSLTDTYTVPAHSQDIFPHIPNPCKVLFLTDWGASHGESIDTGLARYREKMNEFLDTCVPGFGRPAAD